MSKPTTTNTEKTKPEQVPGGKPPTADQ